MPDESLNSTSNKGWWHEALRDGKYDRASTTKLQTLVATLAGTIVLLWCTYTGKVPDGLGEILLAYMGVVIVGRGLSRASDVWELKNKENTDVGSSP